MIEVAQPYYTAPDVHGVLLMLADVEHPELPGVIDAVQIVLTPLQALELGQELIAAAKARSN